MPPRGGAGVSKRPFSSQQLFFEPAAFFGAAEGWSASPQKPLRMALPATPATLCARCRRTRRRTRRRTLVRGPLMRAHHCTQMRLQNEIPNLSRELCEACVRRRNFHQKIKLPHDQHFRKILFYLFFFIFFIFLSCVGQGPPRLWTLRCNASPRRSQKSSTNGSPRSRFRNNYCSRK